MNDDTAPDTPAFVVTGGGVPSEHETAAIALALLELSQSGEVVAQHTTPAWQRAALLEAVGGAAITAPYGITDRGAPGRVWQTRT